MAFAFALLEIVDLLFLVLIVELIDAFCLDWSCVVEVVDEEVVNLRPCSALTDTDIQRLS